MPAKHKAQLFYSLKDLLKEMLPEDDNSEYFQKRKHKIFRYWVRIWKIHYGKNGNTPLILKCGVCSGSERKWQIKTGKFKISKRHDKDYKLELSSKT
jgi:hypothetical protein